MIEGPRGPSHSPPSRRGGVSARIDGGMVETALALVRVHEEHGKSLRAKGGDIALFPLMRNPKIRIAFSQSQGLVQWDYRRSLPEPRRLSAPATLRSAAGAAAPNRARALTSGMRAFGEGRKEGRKNAEATRPPPERERD